MQTRTKSNRTVESAYLPVLSAVQQLYCRIVANDASDVDFEESMYLLETLPLASAEYGVARLRLQNASQYCDVTETGAAAWEVRTLLMQLYANLAVHQSDFDTRPATMNRGFQIASSPERSRDPSPLGNPTY